MFLSMDYHTDTFTLLKDKTMEVFQYHDNNNNNTTSISISVHGLSSPESGYNITGFGVNVTEAPTYYPVLKQPIHMIILYSLAYTLVFLLGILGNSLVVIVVYRNPRMHNVTNYFIVNLAVADILVCLFCLPITLLSNLYSGKSCFNAFILG